ncbi:RAD55 family ATPase [Hydrogenophaga sp. BPS33]|uniref:RAD55 family ATPase n=1 Tax=Hydrogenophaga sp. BPS33 TaxID=2651974 RepID=UPI00131F8345|nr:ATPase domain-containing protein [Hydrogenophaga sp. BPS33]QHE86645.1 AAA family ATPase [Hydrogenophaga sp. BPS33]
MRMKRLPTQVPGLDEILHGGLFGGGVYIFEGPPGVGKTTLANQIAYTLAQGDVCTLYVTMLAESHARMLQHMEGQDFFQRSQVNARVFYISGYREFETDGLKGVVGLLRAELARHRASLLVIDGLVVNREAMSADESVRQFVHELQSLVSVMSCTCLVLTSGHGNALSAEQTMVDGIFAFEDHGFHWRAERRLQVRKFRGSMVIRGSHTFCISDKGLRFFPRLESLPIDPKKDNSPQLAVQHVSSGMPGLDGVLRERGLLAGSAGIVVGESGSGKTTVALAFASSATVEEPALFMTCTETADDLQRAGSNLGLAIAEAVDSGALQIERLGLEDESMDEMGHKVLRLVDELGARRLVIDGLAGLADTLAFPERGYRFLGRLLAELRERGVTSLFTVDPAALAVAAGTALADGVVGLFDNAFDFSSEPRSLAASRETAAEGVGRRWLGVTKVRGGHASQQSVDVQLAVSSRRPSGS